MPIIYFEGIKPPCNPIESQPLVYEGKRRWVTINNNGLRLSRQILPTFKFKLFNISHLLEVVEIRRSKIIGMVPNINFIHYCIVCRSSDSSVSEDAENEATTFAKFAP